MMFQTQINDDQWYPPHRLYRFRFTSQRRNSTTLQEVEGIVYKRIVSPFDLNLGNFKKPNVESIHI